ncbi:MAG: sulfite exporter TauE/SafE family protein [Gemmatimonadaceae bacterium]
MEMTSMIVVGYTLAAFVGLSLGLLGGGGSILTVPIFVYVLGFDPKLAIAMSLPVVGTASLVGAIGHWKAGHVDVRTAAVFGVIAMGGAYGGARLAVFVPGRVQLALLAVIMLVAAVAMLRSARRPDDERTRMPSHLRRLPVGLVVPVALGVGLVTGIVGIGGGFLVVPALVLGGDGVVRLSPKAHASIAALGIHDFNGLMPHELFTWGTLTTWRGIVVIGRAYAGGCASGHAISGLADLQLPSLVAVIGFFAGGLISTWLILPLLLRSW